MKLLIGLGNPGRKYSKTRHNIGFGVIAEVEAQFEFEAEKKKFSSLFGMTKLAGNDICVVKPQTFMNLSGEAVRGFCGYFKVEPKDVLVVHDDIDMALGKLKFAFASGAGGHNGVASIIDHLGTNEFWRLKIGINRPPEGADPAEYVLQEFAKAEKEEVERVISRAKDAVVTFIGEGADVAMQRYHGPLLPS